jgi:hypothetical protein
VHVALRQPGGPQGPGKIVIAAARARRGQIAEIRQLAVESGDPLFLRRVAQMLSLGGESQVAAALIGTQ